MSPREDDEALAVLYALGELTRGERARIDERRATDEALDRLVAELGDVGASLSWALPPVAPPERLRDRLLLRARAEPQNGAEQPTIRFVRAGTGVRFPVPLPGVRIEIMHHDRASNRIAATVQLAPGARYVPHRHGQHEEVVVIAGEIDVDGEVMRRGDYCRAEPGSTHRRIVAGPEGCTFTVSTAMDDEILGLPATD